MEKRRKNPGSAVNETKESKSVKIVADLDTGFDIE